ncbi:MAG: CPBP family intramembrane glutamic endopeptidase [Anaerolineales bacterium]|jgi:membrane protease YdiL (CAAX protease family)|nr:CPBP family intramembrane glutamic endopeptidase [Anaerolineales bacterium]
MLKTDTFPRFDWKIVTITVVSTLLLMVDSYHHLLPEKAYDRTLLYLVVPLLIIVFIFRESPADYGFRLGDWKAGLLITLAAVSGMTLVLWLLLRGDTSMKEYYASLLDGPIPLPLYTFLELIGWEFIFRGWILFGYARKFGPEALWLQAVPFALAHIGKPELETLSTIFGGFAFGWIAWRTRSFIYPFLIHWYIFTLVALLAGGFFG